MYAGINGAFVATSWNSKNSFFL